MVETLVEQDIENIDFSNVAALQQKRTLAFVNHFVITTVQFLNNFMKSCEHKLMKFERKLDKVNASMVLLEAKLSSIPEVNTPSKTESEVKQPLSIEPVAAEPSTQTDTTLPEEEPVQQAQSDVKPEYDRFVKMVQVGVPLDAVKLKLSMEGLDPQELDRILKK